MDNARFIKIARLMVRARGFEPPWVCPTGS
jgi:hypothetical protein